MSQNHHFRKKETFPNNERFDQLCNVCGGPLYRRFSKVNDPITNDSFAILTCKNCGLGHTVPRPENLERYYVKDYYGNRHGVTAAYCLKRSLRIVAHATKGIQGGHLLDVGCGDGSFMLAAQGAGWHVAGTELNPQPARLRGLDVRGSIAKIADGAKFDCITMWHTLEHFRDVKSTLFSLGPLLAPKGRLIIAVPDNGGMQARLFGTEWFHLDVPRHLYHFDKYSLRICLEHSGFVPKYSRHIEFEYSLIGWSQSALNHVSHTPNAFFNILTGKGNKYSTGTMTANVILGFLLTAGFIPAILIEGLFGLGGTIIMVAAKKRQMHG